MSVIPETAQDTFRSQEELRRRALVAADLDALQELLAEEFIYVHASGRSETKQDYIAAVGTRRTQYLGFSGGPARAHSYGDVLVATGTVTAVMSQSGGAPGARSFLFASVWTRNGSAWQLALWQQTEKAEFTE